MICCREATPMGLAALWEQKDCPHSSSEQLFRKKTKVFDCEFDLQTQAVKCWGCFFSRQLFELTKPVDKILKNFDGFCQKPLCNLSTKNLPYLELIRTYVHAQDL